MKRIHLGFHRHHKQLKGRVIMLFMLLVVYLAGLTHSIVVVVIIPGPLIRRCGCGFFTVNQTNMKSDSSFSDLVALLQIL